MGAKDGALLEGVDPLTGTIEIVLLGEAPPIQFMVSLIKVKIGSFIQTL